MYTAEGRECLTKAMRWQIADWMAEERLPKINALVKSAHYRKSIYGTYIKRVIDILVSLIALIVSLPVNLVIAIVTLIDVGRPIFFTQVRTGMNGKVFRIMKFRNMTNETDASGELLPPTQRVTRWGYFVRKTSLDELLNFWSILKGDMSLIGPRPLPPEYTHRYHVRHKARLSVRPGLECPPHTRLEHIWTWQEQFENDVWYVENISFRTDCLMLIRLIQFTLDRKSANARADSSHKGTFMGYDENGVAINVEELPQEYVDRVLDAMSA